MHDLKLQAKLKAIQAMKDASNDMMKNKMKDGIKKVSVMSNSPEGLKMGLEKAKEIASKPSLMDHLADHADESEESEDAPLEESMEGHEEEEQESPEEEAGESKVDEIVEEVQDPEEIDELIKKLQEKQLALRTK